ncbi:UDP-N-acetylmuramate--L-alanine ligase [Candidatus Magnetomoraceae bacterium gMMP-15]
MYKKNYHIHFVGIGGIGMSGIAEILLNQGYQVSGSDLISSEITQRLKSNGVDFFKGHNAQYIQNADVVVISSAISKDNPEVTAALKASLPVIPRAEMLAELMRFKYSIAVAGAHGKTSTTAMISSVLSLAKLDPTVVIGGELMGSGINAISGSGKFIVVEADESDGSLLKMSPTIAVITNIDLEHLDFYSDIEDIKNTFLTFINSIPFYGCSVLCIDSKPVKDIIPEINKPYITYGITEEADFQASDICTEHLASRYKLIHKGKSLGEVFVSLPGIHNVYNSLASITLALTLEIPYETIKQALKNLKGVHRRLEIKGERCGVTVIDDYGHHPTEIKTTLQTLKQSWPEKRLVAVFQPHRYTRTAALFDDFVKAFDLSDILLIIPIYSACENPIKGVDSFKLYEKIKTNRYNNIFFEDSMESALAFLSEILHDGDILLTIGAGDVWKIGERFLNAVISK